MMKSPLNNVSDVSWEKKISVDEIVKSYNNNFNINVRKYFANIANIEIYKCNDTGYRFYYPFTTSGDSDFYIHFQQYDWYYMPWKWEHQICSDLIKQGHRVLEVGCGKGAFLKEINRTIGAACVGLELNESSIIDTQNLKIENISIENFSKNNREQFDLVCSFQVLEHIAMINSFLNAQVDCLKKGGFLVISVPNNDSYFIKYGNHCLNSPPHHMGLWNDDSLKSLEHYFDIKLRTIHYEPLQTYHFDIYIGTKLKKYVDGYLRIKILHLLKVSGLNKIIYKYLTKKADSIKGHTIMAIFEKI